MDKLDGLLEDFGDALGIEGLSFDDEECRLAIDGVTVDIVADRRRGWIVLSSYIGAVPADGRTETLARLLHANCGPDMAGAALGVPAGGDAIVLTDQIRASGLDAAGLADRVATFVTAAGHARRLLGERPPAAPAAEALPADTSGLMRV